VSSAYRQTVVGLSVCIFSYITLIAVVIRNRDFHFLDYNYAMTEFWIFYNLAASAILLWLVYRKIVSARKNLSEIDGSSKSSVRNWQLKTAGTYTAISMAVFFGIIYIPLPKNNTQSNVAAVIINTPTVQNKSSVPHLTFNTNHQFHDRGPDIIALQKFLNSQGFIVAKEGAGSAGHETDYFGPLTLHALIKFQQANNLSAKGYLGWETREFINSRSYSI
jgi:hypothetical protein